MPRTAIKLPLRMTEGLMASVLTLMNQTITAPIGQPQLDAPLRPRPKRCAAAPLGALSMSSPGFAETAPSLYPVIKQRGERRWT